MKHQTAKKIGIGFLRGLLFTVTALLVLLAIGISALSAPLLQKRSWESAAGKEEYVLALQKKANIAVEDECLFYGLESEELCELPTKQTVRDFSVAYMGNLYDMIFLGADRTEVILDSASFTSKLNTYFSTHTTEKMDDETAVEIVSALTAAATAELDFLPIQGIVDFVRSLPMDILLPLLNIGPWVLCLIALGFLVLSFLLGAKSRLFGAQRAAGIFWCVSALWFIPFTLFNVLDLPSQLALDGVARLFAVNYGNAYLLYVQQILSLIFGVATVLLVILTVLRVRKEIEQAEEIQGVSENAETDTSAVTVQQLPNEAKKLSPPTS